VTVTVRLFDGQRHSIPNVSGFYRTDEGWTFLLTDGAEEWFRASIVAAVNE
jgi:hypothetical protein